MTDREPMQQALSALTQASPSGWSMDSTKRHYGTIEALRARLAQPEPEPVDKAGSPCKEFWDWLPKAYRDGDKGNEQKFTKYNMEVAYLAGTRSQREWQGLTDQEQLEIMKQFGPGQRGLFADAIEAKLKEKNGF